MNGKQCEDNNQYDSFGSITGDMNQNHNELRNNFVGVGVDLPSFKTQEIMSSFSNCAGIADSPLWSQNNFTPEQPAVSATIDSQSSMCAGSPTSTLKPKEGDNQVSGSSDEESTDPLDMKRIRRKASNRESARRSRKRKQEQLKGLESQVENLNVENVNLGKQLTEATQQLRNASTNNRVLKSDVEALRAKVKLAEDMLTRGSLSCSSNQLLLQSHIGSPSMNAHTLPSPLGNVSPTVTIRGDEPSYIADMAFLGARNSSVANDNVEGLNGNARSRMVSDAVSGVTEIWPWESQVSTVSK